MGTIETRTVRLSKEHAAFIDALVSSGAYASTSEVLCAALQLLAHEEPTTEVAVERARALIREGAAQLDRGDVLTGEQFFREWDDELAEEERRQPA